jgi:hypothetical protein
VQARPGAALSLAGPADLDDAYQVFDNGRLAGHFGDFTHSKPIVYYTQPKMFPLTPAASRPGPGETSPAEQTRVRFPRVSLGGIVPGATTGYSDRTRQSGLCTDCRNPTRTRDLTLCPSREAIWPVSITQF